MRALCQAHKEGGGKKEGGDVEPLPAQRALCTRGDHAVCVCLNLGSLERPRNRELRAEGLGRIFLEDTAVRKWGRQDGAEGEVDLQSS